GLGGPLRRRAGRRHPRPSALAGRRLPPRHPRPDHLRSRPGPDPGPHLRGARGRQGARPSGTGSPCDGQARAVAAERDRRRAGRGACGGLTPGRGRWSGVSSAPLLTSTPHQREPLRTRPSPALLRAAVAAGAALTLAVLLGRPMLILVGLPLLAWAVVALARRVARGEEHGMTGPRMLVTRPTIEEGGTCAALVTTSPGVLTTVSLPIPPQTDLAPRHGSLAADGTV